MTKLIIRTDDHGIHLTKQHLEWLHNNGYPEADENFCDNDRSNPALVACVEAVHEQMQSLIDKANELLQKAHQENASQESLRMNFEETRKQFCDMILGPDENDSLKTTVNRMAVGQISWTRAKQNIERRFNIKLENDMLEAAYDNLLAAHKDFANQYRAAQKNLSAFCELNGLRINDGLIEVDDGFAVYNYDETCFRAKIVECCDDNTIPSFDIHEAVELIPVISERKIAEFVSGDIAGLMEFLREFNLPVIFEA